MTENGLERTERTSQEYNDDSGSGSRGSKGYRYKNKADSNSSKKKNDSTVHKTSLPKKETNSRSAEQNTGPDADEKLTLLPIHASLFM